MPLKRDNIRWVVRLDFLETTAFKGNVLCVCWHAWFRLERLVVSEQRVCVFETTASFLSRTLLLFFYIYIFNMNIYV